MRCLGLDPDFVCLDCVACRAESNFDSRWREIADWRRGVHFAAEGLQSSKGCTPGCANSMYLVEEFLSALSCSLQFVDV